MRYMILISIIYVRGMPCISWYHSKSLSHNDLILSFLNAHCYEKCHFTETLTNDSNDHKFLAKFLSLSAAATAAACVSP